MNVNAVGGSLENSSMLPITSAGFVSREFDSLFVDTFFVADKFEEERNISRGAFASDAFHQLLFR